MTEENKIVLEDIELVPLMTEKDIDKILKDIEKFEDCSRIEDHLDDYEKLDD